MAIDQTLVKGAGDVAKSKIPIFTGPKYNPSLGVGIQQALTGAAANIAMTYQQKSQNNQKKRENQIAEFTKTADAINRRLSTYDQGGKEAGMHEQIYNNTYDYVQELKVEFERYNTIGKNDTPENKKKRIEILGNLDKIAKATQGLRTDVLTIGKIFGSESGGVYNKTIKGFDLAVGQEIINMDGDYSNVKQRWDNNQIFFDVTLTQEAYDKLNDTEKAEHKVGEVSTMSASDLIKKYKGVGLANEKAANVKQISLDNEKVAVGARLGDEFKYMNSVNRITTILGNGTDDEKAAAGHMYQTNLGNTDFESGGWTGANSSRWSQSDGAGSWAHALESHPSLADDKTYKLSESANKKTVDDLIKSGQIKESEVDTDGKTGISAEEYQAVMTSENRDKIIDALVNPNNPSYDHHVSKNEFAKWVSNQDQMKFDAEQRRKQEKQNQIDADRNKQLNRLNIQGRGSVEIDLLKDEYNRIKTGKRVTYKQKGVTHEFVFDEKKNKYVSQDGTIEYEKERLRSLLGVPYEMAGVDYPEFQDAEEVIFDAEKAKKEQEIKLKKEKEEKEKEKFDKIMKVSGYLNKK
tara:strand:+ start:324 stop:2057 length:1734 start_codon:yes stop_codon:yes gene_type:complete